MPFEKIKSDISFTAEQEGKSEIFNKLTEYIENAKKEILTSILTKALPLFKMNVLDINVFKRITKITFEDDPNFEVYFFDKDLPTEIFIAEIKVVFLDEPDKEPYF